MFKLRGKGIVNVNGRGHGDLFARLIVECTVALERGAASQARGICSGLRRRKHSNAQKFLRTREGILQVSGGDSVVRKSVKLIECPRDAWQGLNRQIPTELKARYLRALIAAGFKHIDAVSFVSPKAVPQMADSENVLEQIDRPDDVEIIGIVVNEKGAERAMAAKAVTTLGYPCSISETFLRKIKTRHSKIATKCWNRSKAKLTTRGLASLLTFRWRSEIHTAIRGMQMRCARQ